MTEETGDQIPDLSDEDLAELLYRYRTDFEFCAPRLLKVLAMEGKIVPFNMNGPQRIMHRMIQQIEKQRFIRLVLLKARRMGFSTYFSARYYHKTSWNFNRLASQVTHEPDATETLFGMVKRFYDFMPDWLRPSTRYNNSRLLDFNTKDGKGLGSGFRVATAAKEDFGSGQLIHYFHGCLAPDTPILVADGREKLIKNIEPGDKVVTHNGHIGEVEAVSRTLAEDLPDKGKMVVIRPWMGYPIALTPQHKIWTNMGWVKAGEFNPSWHMVSMPIREITHNIESLPVKGRASKFGPRYLGPTEFPLNEETGFAIGYYLAEGCISKTAGGIGPYQRVVFALHDSEDHFAVRACNALRDFCKSPAKVKTRAGTFTKTYSLDSGVLAAFIAETFGRVDEKRIPDWVFDCGEDFCRGIVAGYVAGDGSKTVDCRQNYENNAVSISSIRASLVYQVRDLVAALGYGWGSIKHQKAFVCNRGRNNKAQWRLQLSGQAGRAVRQIAGIPFAIVDASDSQAGERYRLDFNNRKVWIKVKNVRETFCDEVFDLAIKHEDHSYRTPHFSVSNSELSKWPEENITDLLTAILQCVPDDPDTEVVYESTAKGIGGEFYDRYWNARYRMQVKRMNPPDVNFWYDADSIVEAAEVVEEVNPDANTSNIYTAIFLPWFCFEKYQTKPPPTFESELTDAETEFMATYGLTLPQLYWRRLTLANKCNGSIDTFNQEYPDCAENAFIAAGRPVFDNPKVMKLKLAARPPAIKYELTTSINQWIANPEGRLSVWQEPCPGENYLISADVAEGLERGDFSSADVINHRTGEQVAHWHGHIDPDLFAQVLAALGYRYNTALLAPERNNHGLTVIKWLHEIIHYPNLYMEMVPDPPGKPRKRYGWQTTSATRPMIIDILVKEIRDDCHGIVCSGTFDEMLAFKIQANGRSEADRGRHDDRVISIGIGKYLRTVLPLPSPPVPEHIKQRASSTRKKPSAKGWT